MIDTVALVWGHTEPLWLDFADLSSRLGDEDGEITTKRYSGREKRFGHWKVGDVDVMYGAATGRLELRASLPKLVAGENDELLDARGVHAGLRDLQLVASEVASRELDVRDARPTRLDYVSHWEVGSVAAILEELQRSFGPDRKRMTYEGGGGRALGRSLYYGKGGKHVLRFYDKRAEVAEKALRAGEVLAPGQGAIDPSFEGRAALEARELVSRVSKRAARREAREHYLREQAGIDTLLRFEVQDRRSRVVRAIHENGYVASQVLAELVKPLAPLAALEVRAVEELIEEAARSSWPHAVRDTLANLHLAEHRELWPTIRRVHHRNTYDRYRRKARAVAVRTWTPVIADDAFGDDFSIWDEHPQEVAA